MIVHVFLGFCVAVEEPMVDALSLNHLCSIAIVLPRMITVSLFLQLRQSRFRCCHKQNAEGLILLIYSATHGRRAT